MPEASFADPFRLRLLCGIGHSRRVCRRLLVPRYLWARILFYFSPFVNALLTREMAKELLDKREIVRRNSAPVRGAEVDAYLAASDLQGQQAVWSLSTAKPGNGVDQLRDGNLDTYWQVCAG